MRLRSLPAILTLLSLLCLLAACAPALPATPSAPAPAEPTTAPTPAEPATAPEPTTAAEAPSGELERLILATTTSTADSGLLDFILPDFEEKHNAEVDVIAVGTGQSLEIGSKGDADVVLVHSRKGEDKFVADGYAVGRFDVMYNDYIIVGPTADPARVKGMQTAKEAFQAIMEAEQVFASRGDNSGTHSKEMSVWASLQITPTARMEWYNSIGQGMGDTLLFANEQEGYSLADRGTYLSMRDSLPSLEVLVGGSNLSENKDPVLLNPYGVLAVNPEKHPNVNAALANQFVEWLLSAGTQEMIGSFGVEKFGQPLFYPNSESFKAGS